MIRYIKIKIKSLATESVIIKQEETKVKSYMRDCRGIQGLEKSLSHHEQCYHGLRQHRINDVRNESRASLLAYGFLRGRKRIQLEKNAPQEWLVERAMKLVLKYGEISYKDQAATKEVFKLWCSSKE